MAVRPTKKQKECLDFIEQFIAEHGYSPSYREIMVGCNYTSVATVALHVKSLLARGHLNKRDKSARSLEVVRAVIDQPEAPEVTETDVKWLIDVINAKFAEVETIVDRQINDLDHLYVLIGALKILGFEDAARAFTSKLFAIKAEIEGTVLLPQS
jgi:SOS-response transcriptional repressor LexA